MTDLLNTIKSSSTTPVPPARQGALLSMQSSLVKTKSMPASTAVPQAKPEPQKDSFINSMKRKINDTPQKTKLLAGGTLIAAAAFLIGLKFRPTSLEREFKKAADKKLCFLNSIFEELKKSVVNISDSKQDDIKKIVDPIARENRIIMVFSRKIEKLKPQNPPGLKTEILEFVKKHKEKVDYSSLCGELDLIYTEIVIKTKTLCDDAVERANECAELLLPNGLKNSKTSKEDFKSYEQMRALLLDNIDRAVQNMQKDAIREKVCEQFRIGYFATESKSTLQELAQWVEQNTKSIT